MISQKTIFFLNRGTERRPIKDDGVTLGLKGVDGRRREEDRWMATGGSLATGSESGQVGGGR